MTEEMKSVSSAVSEAGAGEANIEITLDNVHGLSIYELRKELERRGEYSWGKDEIPGYNKLLQKLVRILMADKEKADQERCVAKGSSISGEGAAAGDTEVSLELSLAQKKAMRKAKALQRSKERQAQAAYFEKVADANKKAKEEEQQNKKGGSSKSENN